MVAGSIVVMTDQTLGSGMRTVYHGELHVHYSQFYVESSAGGPGDGEAHPRAGQLNGLCGAAIPGHLFLTTGLHTGRVHLTVEVHTGEPPPDEQWEEVVEVSFRPSSTTVIIRPWADAPLCEFGLAEADHRVRYCGRDLDRAQDEELSVLEGGDPVDHYLLQFWPAPPGPDRVVRQTSRTAEYWHRHARSLPPPPSPQEEAEAESRRREAQESVARAAREEAEALLWGGRPPSPSLRRVGGDALELVELDRDLVDAVDAAGPEVQRSMARWAARQAVAKAGLTGVDRIVTALESVERGEALPRPFDEPGRAGDWLRTGGPRVDFAQQAKALTALRAAVEPDPLRAALDALFAAATTYGGSYPDLFAAARREMPGPRDS
ncbi:conserved hypothetical protein [Streptomyces viridochromogenes DSM 40736]|uniref:Uncharacterized protein n=2 Tax=Streptomyces viridochromogenes TaxID=1938 RepID=D9XA87_STRVT|nr:conserved hypothetical protein [Streptomyces viridochromogenes DSM 40736]